MSIEIGTSVMEFIAAQQLGHPQAKGRLTLVLANILAGCQFIHRQVNNAGLAGVLGATGGINVQGEEVQKLDVLARNTLVNHLIPCEGVAAISTEEDEGIILSTTPGNYLTVLDPLDGSSNIDVNVSVGTIFSILPCPQFDRKVQPQDFLQPGKNQIAAGYVIYGSGTMLVMTLGNGVHGFTLDTGSGLFLLSHPNIRFPRPSKYYSVNEGNRHSWDPVILRLIFELSRDRSARYIGSLVADFHRNLLAGGVFLYPPDSKSPKGKLRCLSELSTMAMIAEQAGGRSSNGRESTLNHMPTALHERAPFYVGPPDDIALIEARLAEMYQG
ncbi:class 1 fructose-bisphosphatase [Patescibacteria group bacterium]|nr:class 1 fructose-bisphosphatase [Patescibacteria group bacterium]MBU1890375.1 class 1 fructose-bisphosphatase [Patescibacteria group bacterium]